MIAVLTNFIWRILSLSWLTGPIFDKELRVSSRRKRNYWLRFIYLALLTLFLVLIWTEVVRLSGSPLHRASRMAEAGRRIIMTIVWFQFIAIQLIAIIILSTSISDEIQHRTLGVLMTTPINSTQIVLGKLFSRLLQLILLLAISLPVLAIVRVFGGVPWNYLISSLCLTLTVATFVGSLSLFYSILTRKAYLVIIMAFLSVGFLFMLLPFLTAGIWNAVTGDLPDKFTNIILYPNPYYAFAANTETMLYQRGFGPGKFLWPLHCAILLAGVALILLFCVLMVRRVALRQAVGQVGSARRKRRRKNHRLESAAEYQPTSRIRRVYGSPTIWKELRAPLFRRHKVASIIIASITLILLLITYLLFANENNLNEEGCQGMYIIIFMILGCLFTIILPATSITSEKEARSWPLLLATTLTDTQILFGKFIGALRRCMPIWLLLFGHLLLFTFLGYIHFLAIIHIAIVISWLVFFLCCTGLYFSVRFRRTTTAVVMNFVLPVVIWMLMPFLLAVFHNISRGNNDLLTLYIDTNPFVHVVVVIDGTVGESNPDNYSWPTDSRDIVESTYWMLTCALVYVLVGLAFALRARSRLRQNLF